MFINDMNTLWTKEKSDKTINDLKEFRIKSKPSGRKPYYRTHPELVPELKKLLNTHSGEAQDRRRDDIVRFNGLSITDCNDHIKRRLSRLYPKIYKLSNSTIRRLFIPPKKIQEVKSIINQLFQRKFHKNKILNVNIIQIFILPVLKLITYKN